MTKSELLSKIKDGEILAAVENYIAQSEHVEELLAEIGNLQSEKSDLQSRFDATQKKVSEGIEAIKEAVLNPDTPTESAVLAIISDATKSDRERQAESLDEQIAALQKQKEALQSA